MNRNADIVNELKELSPVLSSLKEQEVLPEVPEGYFAGFADNLLHGLNTEDGILTTLSKTTPPVPAGYFDTFGDNILTKIKAEEASITTGNLIPPKKEKGKVITLFQRAAMAATIIGAVFLVKEVQRPVVPVNDCKDGIACLTQDEIYNYMNANSHEFDLQEVQQAVQPVLEKQQGVQKINVSDKEIEQYVKEHNNIIETEDMSTDIF